MDYLTCMEKIKGKETDFISFVVEGLCYQYESLFIDISMSTSTDIYVQEENKLENWSKKDLIDIILKLNNFSDLVYMVVHGFNKENLCFDIHENDRIEIFKMYENMVRNNIIEDKFNLIEEISYTETKKDIKGLNIQKLTFRDIPKKHYRCMNQKKWSWQYQKKVVDK